MPGPSIFERFVDWAKSPLGTRSLQARWRSLAFAPPWPPALCPSASDRRHHRRSAHPAGRTGSTSPHCPNACIYFTFRASRLTFHDPIPLIILPSMILPLLPVDALSVLAFPVCNSRSILLFSSFSSFPSVKNPGSSVRRSIPFGSQIPMILSCHDSVFPPFRVLSSVRG